MQKQISKNTSLKANFKIKREKDIFAENIIKEWFLGIINIYYHSNNLNGYKKEYTILIIKDNIKVQILKLISFIST